MLFHKFNQNIQLYKNLNSEIVKSQQDYQHLVELNIFKTNLNYEIN